MRPKNLKRQKKKAYLSGTINIALIPKRTTISYIFNRLYNDHVSFKL